MEVMLTFTAGQLRSILRVAFDNGYLAGHEDCRLDGVGFNRDLNDTAWQHALVNERTERLIAAQEMWANGKHLHVMPLDGGKNCGLCGLDSSDDIHRL